MAEEEQKRLEKVLEGSAESLRMDPGGAKEEDKAADLGMPSSSDDDDPSSSGVYLDEADGSSALDEADGSSALDEAEIEISSGVDSGQVDGSDANGSSPAEDRTSNDASSGKDGDTDFSTGVEELDLSPDDKTNAGAAAAQSSSGSSSDVGLKTIYQLKWIIFKNKKCPIVVQNENGPCPLISIVNVLLLKGELNLKDTMNDVEHDDLVQSIANLMLQTKQSQNEGELKNYEQNLKDAMDILPRIKTGLDVNVKFNEGVKGFEFTPTCSIFDLLNVTLYHGWLSDPQQREVCEALGSLGYNQLVEKIVTDKTSSNIKLRTQALIVQQFLDETATQLTYYGLSELGTSMLEDEVAVMFRNNHFSTIHKYNQELFLLVTDQGYSNEIDVVWETLSSIDGDTQFVNENFKTIPPKSEPNPSSATSQASGTLSPEQQIDQDHMLAKALAGEDKGLSQENLNWSNKEENLGNPCSTDEELALQMQEVENQAVSTQHPTSSSSSNNNQTPRRQSAQPNQRGSNRKNCTIM